MDSCLFVKKQYICTLKMKGGVSAMLIIPIKDGESIDKALKRYKRKFDRTGVVRELRERQHFTKPSVRRRSEIQRAQYIQHLRDQEEV